MVTNPQQPTPAAASPEASSSREPFEVRVRQMTLLQQQCMELERAMRFGADVETDQLRAVIRARDEVYQSLEWTEDPWGKVQLARHDGRPMALEAAEFLCGDFVPLGGARGLGDDPALVTGYGRFAGRTVVFAGQQRGRLASQKLEHHYGMMGPEGFRKFQQAAQWADRHGHPLITFVDTPGAMPGIEAEQGGIAQSIAMSLNIMAGLAVPTIAIIAGEGGSGGALAMALSDKVLMMENAIYSVIAPEACASILWRDGSKAELAAQLLRLTSADMLRMGVADEVVSEPAGGAHNARTEALATLRLRLLQSLNELCVMDPQQRRTNRFARYRHFGPMHTDEVDA